MSEEEEEEEEDEKRGDSLLLFQTVVYYQCKTCSRYLTTSSKWDSHLRKCLAGAAGSGIGGSNSSSGERITSTRRRPIGFRLLSFKSPAVVIERRCGDVSTDGRTQLNGGTISCSVVRGPSSSSSEAAAASSQNQEDRGRRPRRPSCRKSAANNIARVKSTSTCSKMVEGGGGDDDDDDSSRTTKKKSIKRRYQKRKKRKNSKQASSSKTSPPKPPGKRAKTFTHLDFHPNCVRKYNYSCHLCPGKFFLQKQLEGHVTSVHCGRRSLMPCCVCGRIFNKRDSLNSHVLSHEAAEAREAKFNLLEPSGWGPELLDHLRKYRAGGTTTNSMAAAATCFVVQQSCKWCLLPQCSYPRFIEHIREEHTSSPHTYQFPCKLDNKTCGLKFNLIRELVEHIKASHPKSQGVITRYRLSQGVYTGQRVKDRVKDTAGKKLGRKRFSRANNNNAWTRSSSSEPTTPPPPPKEAKEAKRKKPMRSKVNNKKGSTAKPVKSFTPFQEPALEASSSGDDDDDEEGDGGGGVSGWDSSGKVSLSLNSNPLQQPPHISVKREVVKTEEPPQFESLDHGDYYCSGSKDGIPNPQMDDHIDHPDEKYIVPEVLSTFAPPQSPHDIITTEKKLMLF